jgi:hypothetical protein
MGVARWAKGLVAGEGESPRLGNATAGLGFF